MSILERLNRAIAYAQKREPGLSQNAIAERARLSKGYLGRIKSGLASGEMSGIKAETAIALSEALGVRTEWLVQGSGRMAEDEEVAGPGPDALELALAAEWWLPDEMPPIELVSKLTAEARDLRAKGAVDVHAAHWVRHLRQRAREVAKPKKSISTTVHDDPDDPLGGLSSGIGGGKATFGKKGR